MHIYLTVVENGNDKNNILTIIVYCYNMFQQYELKLQLQFWWH